MIEKKPFYITTTLPYVNDIPHVGTALEFVQADVLARFARLSGQEVFFNTGADEHGLKIYQKAQESGITPQEYVDEYASKLESLVDTFNISHDAFIRTTANHHKEAAQEIWKRCDASGDIYKKQFKGLYCVSDEMFIRESDLVDGKCPNHPNKDLVEMEEENYFFKLSSYQDKLIELIESDTHEVLPDFRKQEILSFIKGGLEDISISRRKKTMPWGVDVPGDTEHVMYVWFDALTNYISTLGWPDEEGNFKTFWKEGKTHQCAGKDQPRFQSVIWQAMLISAGLPTTQKLFYHGFITSEGKKMSKSVGNVISPFDVINDYGVDSLRYILLRHVHPFQDSDLTWDAMKEHYNANLANGLGNLTSRIIKMASSYEVETTFPEALDVWNYERWSNYKKNLENFEFNSALDELWKEIGDMDTHIAETEPFKLIKTEPEKAKDIVKDLLKRLHALAVLLEPCMPETSAAMLESINNLKVESPLFVRKD